MTSGPLRAERKHATVMFADIVGFTALSEAIGPERAYLIVTECLKRLDGIVRRHGGAVDKYLGDCLMAVFGHPVPLENDATAGVEAALEMRRLVRDYVRDLRLDVPLDIYIGLNTGPLVAGELRGAARREFHVLGDTVNIAARLKQRSPNGAIYVGAGTEERTRDHFEYHPLDALKLKGKETRVPTFALLGAREPAQAGGDDRLAAELVGRATELEQLRGTLLSLAGGRGGVVRLTGAEGIGKTRLLAELRRSDEMRNLGVLETHPKAAGRRVEFRALPGLVRSWARLGADATVESQRSRLSALVQKQLGDASRQLLPSLLDLLELSDGRSRGVRPRREPLQSEAIVAALEQLLSAVARKSPTLVIFEDLQDADPGSLEVIEQLAGLAVRERLLFALVSREPIRATQPSGADPEHELELRLERLSAEESDQLLDTLSEAGALGAIRSDILERASGNPRRLILGTFLAPALRAERAQHGASERSAETERRRATVVFADITGFTSLTEGLGDQEAYAVVADALALLDEVAQTHGGTVDKYLGDCVMALFGVPQAIEDAPRAAVNAAIEMRARIREFNRERGLARPLDVHTGINTGMAISGDISGPLIREFALMGEPVDVANRLSDLAPAGQIFVGEQTQRFTQDVFDFRPTDPLQLPGQPDSIPAYEVVSDRVQLHRRRVGGDREIFAELIGRDSELAELRHSIENVIAGRGGVVSLIGEAGLGKSRLLAELRASHQVERVEWLEGRSLSVGGQLSYHPFADLMRSLAGIVDEDPEEVVPAKLEWAVQRLFGQETRDVYPLLASRATRLASTRSRGPCCSACCSRA
jgi:class 3 adenylate cyclase